VDLNGHALGSCTCGGAFVPLPRGRSGLICNRCGWTTGDLEVAIRGHDDEIVWMPLGSILDAYR
jgi:hypothetical protein